MQNHFNEIDANHSGMRNNFMNMEGTPNSIDPDLKSELVSNISGGSDKDYDGIVMSPQNDTVSSRRGDDLKLTPTSSTSGS